MSITPIVQLGRPRSFARRTLALVFVLSCSLAVTAAAQAAPKAPAFTRDQTPLPADISGSTTTTHAATAAVAGSSDGGGSAVLRMLFGLAIVLAVIYGLYRLLKRSANKNDKSVRSHGGMTVVASTPLAQSRALHLVQVGDELVLVGSSEQGVTPIRVYDAAETRRLGLEGRDDFQPLANGGNGGSGGMGFGNALVETLKRKTAR
jgi:flagellar biosynthetic protein FliO